MDGPEVFFKTNYHLKIFKIQNFTIDVSKKNVVLDYPKKKPKLGHFSVHKNAPALIFLENLGQQFFFQDLLTFKR